MGENYVLAADLGGTNLRTAAVSRDGSILHQRKAPTPQTSEAADIIRALADEALACASSVDGKAVGFGVAAAALVDLTGTRVLSSPNISQLNGVELSAAVRSLVSIPVFLENDATAAAIGEHWLGASRHVENSVCVTLGTGVGGGLIIGGRPFRGTGGTAGEVGHICVEPDGVECGCGSHGCLEQYASATAIVRIARELRPQLDGTASQLTSDDVYKAACSGEAFALETFRRMGRHLGIALADLVDVLNPGMIVIGGGASGAWDLFIEHVRSEIRLRAFKHPAELLQIVRAELGDNAGILGAASVAFEAAAPSSKTIQSLS
jgi:glucokinase